MKWSRKRIAKAKNRKKLEKWLKKWRYGASSILASMMKMGIIFRSL